MALSSTAHMIMAARGIVEQQHHDTESESQVKVKVAHGPAQEGGSSALSSKEGARQHAVQRRLGLCRQIVVCTAVAGQDHSVGLSNKATLSDAPEDVVTSSLSWLDGPDLGKVMAVSRRWHRIGGSDFMWLPLYSRRFGRAASLPELFERVGLDPGDTTAASEGRSGMVRFAFRSRLACPVVGDHVEVAWKGKFRLDDCMVFIGLSWWDAKVVAVELGESLPYTTPDEEDGDDGRVDRRGAPCMGERRPKRFLVHYRSWSRRWDEWLEPSRVRWARKMPTEACGQTSASAGPVLEVEQEAELWCHGGAGGGAWLEARVHKISRSLVCLSDRHLASQLHWVSRDRVRPKWAAPRPIPHIVARAYGGRGSAATGNLEDHHHHGDRASVTSSSSRRWRRLPTSLTFPAQHSRRNSGLRLERRRAMSNRGDRCCIM